MLFDERPELPGLGAIDAEFVKTLTAGSEDRFEIYREAMDLSRFQTKDYDSFLLDKLRTKYASKKIDVVVAILGPALDFLLRYGDAIFPGVPIVFCGFDRWELGDRELPQRVSGVLLKREFAPTLDLVLHVHPDTQRAVVIAGVSEFDTRLVEQMRTEFQPYERRLTFTYLTGLPLPDTLAAVRALPPRTIVLFSTFFRDARGQSSIPHDVIPTISAASAAPVYGFVDQYLGRGLVGGSFYSLATQGSEAARRVRDLLAGRALPPSSLVGEGPSTTKMFDWRQMQRWNISESRLPVGSEIRFRQLTIWDQYWQDILLIISAILIQSTLIGWLIYEHRRRQIAEALSLQRVNELARMNRFATAGALSASLAHEIRQPLTAILMTAATGVAYLKEKAPKVDELRRVLDDMIQETHRAEQIVAKVRAIFKGGASAKDAVDLNRLVEETLKLARQSIDSNNIVVNLQLDSACPPVRGDRIQLQQVVLNLISNAVEAMSNGAEQPRTLGIETSVDGASVLLTVSDTGPTMDPTVAAKMFEPLFTTKSNGMGIGLSLSKSIIGAHGGNLTAKLKSPRGLELRVSLPSN